MKTKYIIAVLALLSITSCTLTVHPDGSRTYGSDPQAAAAVTTAIIEAAK